MGRSTNLTTYHVRGEPIVGELGYCFMATLVPLERHPLHLLHPGQLLGVGFAAAAAACGTRRRALPGGLGCWGAATSLFVLLEGGSACRSDSLAANEQTHGMASASQLAAETTADRRTDNKTNPNSVRQKKPEGIAVAQSVLQCGDGTRSVRE